jgi:hypothetical protein
MTSLVPPASDAAPRAVSRAFTPLLTIHSHSPARGHSSAPSRLSTRRRAPSAITATELTPELSHPFQSPEQRLWVRVFGSLREDLERRGRDHFFCQMTSRDRARLDFVAAACEFGGGVAQVEAEAERARREKAAARKKVLA